MLRSIVLVAVVLALANAAVFDPYSRRYGVCKNTLPTLLMVPAGASHCTLITGMLALSAKVNLTTTQSAVFTTFVNSIESSIINNASISNQTDKLNMVAASFQNFSMDTSATPDNGSYIYGLIANLNISTWGNVDMVVKISNEWNMQDSLKLVVASDIHGNCKLFDSLLAACTDAPKKAALQAFINAELKKIVASSSSETDCIQQIQDAFETKFFMGPQKDWKSYFAGLKLKGSKISFSQFSSCAGTFQKKKTSVTVLSGPGTTCPFILSLNASLSFTNLTLTQKGFIKQLINYFQQQWTTTLTFEARLNLISMKFSESIDLSSSYFAVLNGIPIPGFGSFWDLIVVSCQINIVPTSCGCVKPVFHEMTTTEMVPTTTTMMMTTTTEMPSTTTKCSCTCDM